MLFETGEALGYAELEATANQLAHLLRERGVRRGDCVLLHLSARPLYFAAVLGAMRCGAYVALLDPSLTSERFRYVLENSEAKAVLTGETHAAISDALAQAHAEVSWLITGAERAGFEALEEALERQPTSPIVDEQWGMYMLYTSGTTGRPKGVRRGLPEQQDDLIEIRYGRIFRDQFGCSSDTVALVAGPLHNVAMTNAGLATAALGGTTVLLKRFTARRALEVIETYGVTHSQWTPLHFVRMLKLPEDVRRSYDVRSMQSAIHASSSVPVAVKRQMIDWWGPVLYDDYGMTEGFGGCAITSLEWLERPGSVGRAYVGELHIVGEDGEELPVGEVGTIYFDSDRPFHYHKEPEKTAAAANERGWRTVGDKGRVDADGYLYLAGRSQDAIQIGSVSVYPLEVEDVIIAHPQVREVGVVGVPNEVLGEEVVAAVVPRGEAEAATTDARALIADLRARCQAQLPPHARPTRFLVLEELPRSSVGKLLRRELRVMSTAEAVAERFPRAAPSGASQERRREVMEAVRVTLARALAREGLSLPGERVPFMEHGMSSLLAVAFAHELSEALGQPVAVSAVFSHGTIAALTEHLCDPKPTPTADAAATSGLAGPVAIIGMACRFPGGVTSPAALWALLTGQAGDEVIVPVPPSRWDAASVYDPDPEAPGRLYVNRGGFIDGLWAFDPAPFELAVGVAERMSPHERILLEVAWEALEDAAISPQAIQERDVGFFIAGLSDDPKSMSTLAGRLSHTFGTWGPSVAFDTGCSGSLVALHAGCQSLATGDSDVAVVGGISLLLHPHSYMELAHMRALSPTHACRPFGAGADGFVRSEGCGLLVLKPLARALEDGDPVRAVVMGSAVMHNGRTPRLRSQSSRVQARMIRTALKRAGLTRDAVDYVETHGPGTLLGDPIEAEALREVFGDRRGDALPIGSVKATLGHTEAAAGVAGLMTVVEAMHHQQLPVTRGFEQANPDIPLQEYGLSVVDAPRPWPATRDARVASVSSFGLYGTNAHVVVRQPLPITEDAAVEEERPWPVVVSAQHGEALFEYADALGRHIASAQDTPLSALSATLTRGRAGLQERLGFVASSAAEAARVLSDPQRHMSPRVHRGAAARPRIAFVFPGSGSHVVGMGRELYARFHVFRDVLDTCDRIARPILGQSLKLFEPSDTQDQTSTRVTQPAIFAAQCALVELWRSLGVEPDLLVGHSLGEYAAAWAAGCVSLKEALTLVCERARLLEQHAPGAMCLVYTSSASAERLLRSWGSSVTVAAVNGPERVTLSGAADAIADAHARLEREGLRVRRLRARFAAHSPAVDGVLAPLHACASRARWRPARVPLLSCVDGERREQLDAAYWVHQTRQPIRFDAQVASMEAAGVGLVIELGAAVLTPMLAELIDDAATPLLNSMKRRAPEHRQLVEACVGAWVHGAPVDWAALDEGARPRRARLPTYAFRRRPLDPGKSTLRLHGEVGAQASRGPLTEPPASRPPPPAAREPLSEAALRDHVEVSIRQVMGIAEGAPLAPTQDLLALGMDSVMALELRDLIARAWSSPIPADLILSHPSLQSILDALQSE